MTDMRIETEVELPVHLPDPRPSDPLEALSWLGETEEDVVRALRERGIKGRAGQVKACPLYNYLAAFGWDYGVCGICINVSPDPVFFKPLGIPSHLRSFIGAFDNGAYPDLIAD